jgi:hypothetical protein
MDVFSGMILFYSLLTMGRLLELSVFMFSEKLNGLDKYSRAVDDGIIQMKSLRDNDDQFWKKSKEVEMLLQQYIEAVDKYGKIDVAVCLNPLISIRKMFPITLDSTVK